MEQGGSAFEPCLLLLHERLAGVPGLADLFACDIVAALELVEKLVGTSYGGTFIFGVFLPRLGKIYV